MEVVGRDKRTSLFQWLIKFFGTGLEVKMLPIIIFYPIVLTMPN
jgi:hypothetical protein